MTLWTLAFLTFLAANLGSGVRQRIILLSRLESRDKLRLVTEAGVQKAVMLLNEDLEQNQFQFSLAAKNFRQNNEMKFKSIELNGGISEVSYEYTDGPGYPPVKRYGLQDEESKINVNTADARALKNLFKTVLQWDDSHSQELADNIIEWREPDGTQLKGFYSQDYYENLSDPYSAKKAKFELLDELLLIKNVDLKVLQTLRNYLTVYGDSRVNINTASRPVLVALGLTEEVADKILSVRRGKDGIDGTLDDHVFLKSYDVASEVKKSIEMNNSETAQIDQLNAGQKIDTNSYYYSVAVYGRLQNFQSRESILCVMNAKDSKIEYWREE